MRQISDQALGDAVLGFLEYNLKQYGKARDYLEKAIRLDPEFGEAYAYLSVVQKQLGNQQDADIYRRKAEEYGMDWLMNQ
ncbi:MAG TPA: tetratricopeptide repeat protein [Bacteroidota bacterium]|nr:tetratricopeptide repeat protein [Bacteroidota bacterium]